MKADAIAPIAASIVCVLLAGLSALATDDCQPYGANGLMMVNTNRFVCFAGIDDDVWVLLQYLFTASAFGFLGLGAWKANQE